MVALNNRYVVKILDSLISILVYAIILIGASLVFKNTIYIDNSMFGLYSILASTIIFILNRTIRPILIWLTLPLTALTLGLFYPVVNVVVLKLTDFILMSHFKINGYIMPFFLAIIISFVYMILEHLINKILGVK